MFKKPGENKNILVTHAIGEKYLENWKKNSLPSWLFYCKKHDLGLFVLIETIQDDGKTMYWQKLLIASELKSLNLDIKNACYLDTDIIINPGSPNIFDIYNPKFIALVSQYKNLPYNRLSVLKRVAYFRHNFYNKNYPLDSSLFFSAKEQYKYHKLTAFDDYACMGLFVFNILNHSNFLLKLFNEHKPNMISIDGGGEEVYLNHKIIKEQIVQWIPYKWQSLWIFEMPWCHSHLYFDYNKNSLINSIQTSLFNCYFLHFAGSWEGIHHEECSSLFKNLKKEQFIDFENYTKIKLKRKPQGRILREKNNNLTNF